METNSSSHLRNTRFSRGSVVTLKEVIVEDPTMRSGKGNKKNRKKKEARPY